MSTSNMFKRLIDPADSSDLRDLYLHLRPTIPMDRALLCLDCEAIFEAEGHQTCPACGSATAWAIGRALNREPREVLAHSLQSKADHDEPRRGDARPGGRAAKRANGNGRAKDKGNSKGEEAPELADLTAN